MRKKLGKALSLKQKAYAILNKSIQVTFDKFDKYGKNTPGKYESTTKLLTQERSTNSRRLTKQNDRRKDLTDKLINERSKDIRSRMLSRPNNGRIKV